MKWLLGGVADFWACTFGTMSPRSRVFHATPPPGQKTPIFIRRECPAAFEKLVETGETAQGMFLSTREQGEMVVGWLAWRIFGLALLAQSLPDLGCFLVYPPRAIGALIFVPCECSAGCQSVSETGETAQGMFLSIRAQGEMVAGWRG